jgi:hypothetical protein
MKKIASLAVLAATTSVFAWDEYGALGAKKLEVDVMLNYTSYTGGYDADGKKQDMPDESSASTMSPVLGVKYGIIDGLDVELAVPYVSNSIEFGDKDNSVSGLGATNLGVKYTHATGFGGFVAVDLPFGSEDIVGKDPATSIYAALQYTKTFGKVALNDFVLYKTTLEVEDMKPADLLQIYVKPQYNVTDKVGLYLGLDYQMNLGKEKTVVDPTEEMTAEELMAALLAGADLSPVVGEVDPEFSLLTLKPGVNYIVNDAIGIEATAPVTVMGKNADASIGAYLGFYYTIGL